MSKAEARQHFVSLHLYWHGPGHCWDATAGRRHQVRKIRPNDDRQVQRARSHPDWRQAMSEMQPDDEPVRTPAARTTSGAAAWSERWVDIASAAPQPIAEIGPGPVIASPALAREPESTVTPRVVIVLAFFALVMIFATIEILFHNAERQE